MATKAVITEKYVKDKIKKIVDVFAKYNDVYTLTPMTMGFGESGHPDRLLLINGVLIGIEAKKDADNYHTSPSKYKPLGKRTPKSNEVMQKRQRDKIIAAGGLWVCIHRENLNELILLLEQHASTKPPAFSEDDYMVLYKLMGD